MHRIRLPSSRRPLLSPGVLVALASRPPLPASPGRPDVVSDVSVSGVLMSSSTSRCRRVVGPPFPTSSRCCPRRVGFLMSSVTSRCRRVGPPFPPSSRRPDVVPACRCRPGVLMSSSTSRCRRVVSAIPAVVPASRSCLRRVAVAPGVFDVALQCPDFVASSS